jgi:chemotaxis protein MotB
MTTPEPPPAPAPQNDRRHETIVIKKIIASGHGGHHGGAWKVAYADFVTAMMAFFLLLWIVGATNEDQRKGIADYFAPTLVKHSQSGGSNGILKGRSILAPDGVAPFARPAAIKSVAPIATSGGYGDDSSRRSGGVESASDREASQAAFDYVKDSIQQQMKQDRQLQKLAAQVAFVQAPEGLRIELIDQMGTSLFEFGSDRVSPEATSLFQVVAAAVAEVPNNITIRGHTDAYRYKEVQGMNNWLLSVQRAERTRLALAGAGVAPERLSRIEGVADREPYILSDPMDPRNRRVSITLLYR